MHPLQGEDLIRRQVEVRGDVERLLTHAERLSAVWTGLKMDGPDIVVLLTDPRKYEHELRALVEHPDRLRFEQSRHTRVQLDEVRRQTIALIGDQDWTSHGPGLDRVTVTLHSNRTALAQQLHDRFGDAIAITLGRHHFPLDQTAAVPAPRTPRSTIDLPNVTFAVRPDEDSHRTGEDIRGDVTIQNNGTTHLELETGRLAFGVLLDTEHHVVGDWTGLTTLPGGLVTLAPGETMSRFFIAGSDTFDPQLGASLPPGTYLLAISIDINEYDPEATEDPSPYAGDPPRHRRQGQSETVVTTPITIQITAAGDN